MSEATKYFADRLSDLIEENGKPFRDLAKEIGISTGSLSKYQNDAAVAGVDALAKISKYFGVSVDWLLGLSETMEINGELSRACDYTGLSVDSVRFLNRAATGEDFDRLIAKIIDEIASRGCSVSEYIAKYLLCTFRDDEEYDPHYLENDIAHMRASLAFYHFENRNTMIQIPAADASQLYLDASIKAIEECANIAINTYCMKKIREKIRTKEEH